MATTTNLEKLVINYLTQEQYDDAREAGILNANELYLTPDTGSTGGTVTSIATGGGLTGGPITSSGTISHDDTSSQSSVSNSGRTYIQSVTLDTYGHVTGLSSATETVTNSDEKVKVTNYTTSNSVYPIFYTGSNTPATTTQNVNVTDFVYVLGTNDRTLRIGSTSKTGKLQLGQLAGYTATITPTTLTANQTYTFPNKTGTIALTSDIPTVPTNISAFTNDAGYITSADVPEGASAYTGTISAVGTTASSGTNNGFARGDHVHNITSATIISALGFTPISSDSDENVKSTAVTAATTNYIVGSTTSTTTTGGLSKHASAVLYTTADSSTSGYTQLRLGNATATTSAGGKEGQIRLYGTGATYYLDLKPGAIASSNKTITFPNKTGTVALTDDIPSYTDTNTTYTLTNALSSHKFTWTFTAGGSGSGSTTTTAELVQGSNITLTDDTNNKKITIAATDTTYGIATYNTAGLVKPWKSYTGTSSGPTATSGTTAPTINAISNTSGKYYAVEMDSNGRMFVNVPWEAGEEGTSYTATSPISIDSSNVISHDTSGVTAGTYTAAAGLMDANFYIPSFTVDDKGHITNASATTAYIPPYTFTSSNYGLVNYSIMCRGLYASGTSLYDGTITAGSTSSTITYTSTGSGTGNAVDVIAWYSVFNGDTGFYDYYPVIVDWTHSAYGNSITISIKEAFTYNIYFIVLIKPTYATK